MDAVEMLLNEECSDNIVLYGENDEQIEFQQIALINLEGKLHAILKPVNDDTLGEDEALVFTIEETEEEIYLSVCEDDDIIDRVFAEFYRLLQEDGTET